jgi:hypothetical protein
MADDKKPEERQYTEEQCLRLLRFQPVAADPHRAMGAEMGVACCRRGAGDPMDRRTL